MTSKESGQTEDKKLLDRYRRASDSEAAAPSGAVRAAILAESRRVAEQLAAKGPQHSFDVSRPAANDSRWKIAAFGTVGAALLAALLIAPRYWETLPASKVATAQLAAPAAAPAREAAPATAPVPKLESVAPAESSESSQEVVVTQAKRRRPNSDAASSQVASSTKPASAPLNDTADLSIAPVAPPSAVAARSADSTVAYSANRIAGAAQIAPMPARLQSAAGAGDVAQATVLLDAGAVLDARDGHGRTPLMLAVEQGQLEIVRLLLQRGADPNAVDDTGRTPLQKASKQNLKAIAALLQSAGAH